MAFQEYNYNPKQEMWGIVPEKSWELFIYPKNKPPKFRGFGRTFVQWCLVLSGLLDTLLNLGFLSKLDLVF